MTSREQYMEHRVNEWFSDLACGEPTRSQRIRHSEAAAWIILREGRSTLIADSIDGQLTCVWWL
jgi:hypothetical protein